TDGGVHSETASGQRMICTRILPICALTALCATATPLHSRSRNRRSKPNPRAELKAAEIAQNHHRVTVDSLRFSRANGAAHLGSLVLRYESACRVISGRVSARSGVRRFAILPPGNCAARRSPFLSSPAHAACF